MTSRDYDELKRLREIGCRLVFCIRNGYRYAATEMPKYSESPELELPNKIHNVTSGTLRFCLDGDWFFIAAAIADYEREHKEDAKSDDVSQWPGWKKRAALCNYEFGKEDL